MTGRKLRSRSCSVESRAGSTQGNLEDSNLTECSQVGEVMATEIQESEIPTSNPDRESATNKILPLTQIPLINPIAYPRIS